MKKAPFEAFTITVNGKAPSLVTSVLIFPPVSEEEIDNAENISVNAIWDTGATRTCIHPKVAKQLKLSPVGQAVMKTAGKTCSTYTYLANIILPNRLLITTVLLTALDEEAEPECLIGMDIIGMGDFSVSSFEGNSCFTFRYPSYKKIDFVAEHLKIVFGGTQPYHACPCGAKYPNGLPVKYKDCHKKVVDNPPTTVDLLPDNGKRAKLI